MERNFELLRRGYTEYVETPIGIVNHTRYSNADLYLGPTVHGDKMEMVLVPRKGKPFGGYPVKIEPVGASVNDSQPDLNVTIDGQEGVSHIAFGSYINL